MIITDINNNQREAKSITPDPNYPGYLKIEFQKRFDWYSIKEFIDKNPALSYLVKEARAIPEDTLGVVTNATETSIQDAKQNLKENAYVGFVAWISRGKGEGQKRTITSNTRNTITVEAAWEVQPDATSQYVLSHNIHDVTPHGNTLPTTDIEALTKPAKKHRVVAVKKTRPAAKKKRIKAKKTKIKKTPVKPHKKVVKLRKLARKKPTKIIKIKAKKKTVKKAKVIKKTVAKKRSSAVKNKKSLKKKHPKSAPRSGKKR